MFLLAGDPHNIPTATGDPFKTLFVARIVSVTVEIIFLCLNIYHVCLPFMILIRDGLTFHFRTMTLQSPNCEENLKFMDQ